MQRYPDITFRGTEVERRDERRARVVGDLTIRGVTRQIALETELLGRGKSPAGYELYAFSAATKIDRTEFGMTWNAALETGGVLVGPELTVDIELQAKVPAGVSAGSKTA